MAASNHTDLEIFEMASSHETTFSVDSPKSMTGFYLKKMKTYNRVGTPSVASSADTYVSSPSKISDLFTVKESAKLPPIPRKRNIKDAEGYVKGDLNSLLSSKSNTYSYKKKLRDRFLSMKQRAGITLAKTKKLSSKYDRSVLEKDLEELKRENLSIGTEVDSRLKNKDDIEVFFCKEENNTEAQELTENDKDEIIEVVAGEQKISIEALNADNYDEDIVTTYIPASVCSLEEENLWRPSKLPLTLNEKQGDESQSQYLEEDGFYVGNKPRIGKSQLVILEQRLYCGNNRKWFDCNGELKMLPDPRQNVTVRPSTKSENLLTEYKPPESFQASQSSRLLVMCVIKLQFQHHPLFSAEHVQAQKLKNEYESYRNRVIENRQYLLGKRLTALRLAKNNTINAGGDNEKVDKFNFEISKLRELHLKEGKIDRDLMKTILATWKMIKHLRKVQKYRNTSVRLVITKQEYDAHNEEEDWNKNIQNAISETIENLERTYEKEMNQYHKDIKKWKNKKSGSTSSNSDNDDMIEKPKRPQKPNFDNIKTEVEKRYYESFKPPGEPVIHFELKEDDSVDENVTENENVRRSAVKKTQIFLKFFCDNQEICRSKNIRLNNSFVCSFEETISFKPNCKSEKIKIVVCEQTSLLSKKSVGEINVAVPETSEDFNNAGVVKMDFSAKESISYNHTGVGSPYNLDNENTTLDIKGTISYSIGWENDVFDNHLEKETTFIDATTQEFEFDSENILDPQDPENTIHDFEKQVDYEDVKDGFRLAPEISEFDFCDMSEIENNIRFKLLQLRFSKEPEFQGLAVSNRIREIPVDLLHLYNKRINERLTTNTDDESDSLSIEGQRLWGRKHLKQIYNSVLDLCVSAEQNLQLKDLIEDDNNLSFSALGNTFLNWLQPKRPLRPKRKSKSNLQTGINSDEPKITVSVVSALDVPSRRFTDEDKLTNDDFKLVDTKPFLVVTFKNRSVRTTVANGTNPVWNQELIIPLKPSKESLLPLHVQYMNEYLFLQLYDEITTNLVEDDRLQERNIHQHISYNWLGGIEIPFNTLLHNNQMEGTFRVLSPPVLLGYERNTQHSFATPQLGIHQNATYLNLFITLQYPNSSKNDFKMPSDVECIELQLIKHHITLWQEKFNKQFPHRRFSSLVINTSGKTCSATRFFTPLKPPSTQDENQSITPMQCVRFVSMIPFYNGSYIFQDGCNVWLTGEQLLRTLVGSVYDHVILLICYFMELKIPCWMLLGYGIPHGKTAYVLTKEKLTHFEEYYVYDVVNVQRYGVRESFCSLQQAFCAISDENVWGNIQKERRLHVTNFDFSKTNDWLPLFNNQHNVPMETCQIGLKYKETPDVSTLEAKIEKRLKNKFMKWRKHDRTIWNHYCSSTFKKLLLKMEKLYVNDIENVGTPKHSVELQNLQVSYEISGFPLHFRFTSVSNIVESVKAIGIQHCENPRVEFALAVHIHPYHSSVLVVWVYIATLVRKR